MTATGQRKPGRPATGSVRLEFRASADIARWLTSRKTRMDTLLREDEDERSLNLQASAELILWQAVLRAELHRIRLTLPQALAIADVLKQPVVTPAVNLGMGSVYAQCDEAFRLARSGPGGDISSFGAKHGMVEQQLLDYLGSLGPAADHALADAISRWWAEVVPLEGPAGGHLPPIEAGTAEGFAIAGLRIVQ